MEALDKLETAAALAAIRAVIDSGPGISKQHALSTAASKLHANLKEFIDSPDEVLILTHERIRSLVFQAGGAATRPLLQDHPGYIFPSERVKEAIEFVLDDFGIPKEEINAQE